MITEALDAAAVGASAGKRTREIARDLRSLRDCYVGTTVPRLREALVREAHSCVDRLRRALAAERRRSA
jgi:hypothetical protein